MFSDDLLYSFYVPLGPNGWMAKETNIAATTTTVPVSRQQNLISPTKDMRNRTNWICNGLQLRA
jgi:hypothetical protein